MLRMSNLCHFNCFENRGYLSFAFYTVYVITRIQIPYMQDKFTPYVIAFEVKGLPYEKYRQEKT